MFYAKIPTGSLDIISKSRHFYIKKSRHSPELVPSGLTYVHIDAIQMGVGSVNSWGSVPLEQYHVKPVAREFRFVLSPVVVL